MPFKPMELQPPNTYLPQNQATFFLSFPPFRHSTHGKKVNLAFLVLLALTCLWCRFTEEEDNNLVRYLATESKLSEDPMVAHLYAKLGPGSRYEWSHEDLQERSEQLRHKLQASTKPKSSRKKKDIEGMGPPSRIINVNKKKNKVSFETPTTCAKTGSAAVSFPASFRLLSLLHRVSGQFDVERDILRIANGTRLPPDLVRGVVVTTGSIVETNRVLELVSAGLTNWDVSDCGEPNSDDEEEDEVVVKVEKPRVKPAKAPALKAAKRRRDDYDSSEEEQPKSKKAKKAVAKVPPSKKHSSNSKPKKQYVESDSDDDTEAGPSTRSCSAYHIAAAIERASDMQEDRVDNYAALGNTDIPAEHFYAGRRIHSVL
ncbi:hypothetical protein B0H13DRAFT_2336768 [Mycena leptocephala]|nr:hypothetical protein B0H13DRAFT_2336768 [Mycena leptocephala]